MMFSFVVDCLGRVLAVRPPLAPRTSGRTSQKATVHFAPALSTRQWGHALLTCRAASIRSPASAARAAGIISSDW